MLFVLLFATGSEGTKPPPLENAANPKGARCRGIPTKREKHFIVEKLNNKTLKMFWSST